MTMQNVLIAGQWRPATAADAFRSENPATGETLPEEYPVSGWADCAAALDAAASAADQMRRLPPERLADFLDRFAERIEQRADEIAARAHQETAYPVRPRLAEGELPRTTGQLRQAAAAAREQSWSLPTVDTKLNIRSYFAPLGPVCVFGPNNFPLAFNSIGGGDFAAAIAAGNPVIGKANTSHPGTTRLLAEEAHAAATETGLPAATVQLIYRLSHEDGARLVADERVGATAYTGSRSAGLQLKSAADTAGKPIYLELSSINPIVILPGALAERGEAIADEFTASCLLGSGQFCTNPGLVLLVKGPQCEPFVAAVAERFKKSPSAPLLSRGVAQSLAGNVGRLIEAGATLVTGGQAPAGPGYRYANTLLRVAADRFLAQPTVLQSEAFGNASLMVVAADAKQAAAVIAQLEGNLTGSIYSDTCGGDDALYVQLEPQLRVRVGRLLNDKMPTGVAVSPAMNHGGPYPATGHPGFTAVGIPASLRRFAMLACYDNVRPQRLPAALQNGNPTGRTWRLVDGAWSVADIAG